MGEVERSAVRARAGQLAKEGHKVDWQKLLAEAFAAARVSGVASQVGGGAHLFLALPEQAHELRNYERLCATYERLCATVEAFIYAAMTRLMVRRLARAWVFSNSFSGHFGE